MSRRLKFHLLTRLIPLAERNYNLVELGPRDVPADILEKVDPIFYGDVRQAAFKSLGLV